MKRGRPKGWKMPQKVKDKISESKKGKRQTARTKKRISDGVKRKHHTISIERIMATDLEKAGKVKQNGYVNVYIPQLDSRKEGNYMRLHVAMMEQKLGRKLERSEEVHHWGSKDNNLPMLLTLAKNKKQHVALDRSKKNLYKVLKK